MTDDDLLAVSFLDDELHFIPVADPDRDVEDILNRISGLSVDRDRKFEIPINKHDADTFTLEIDGNTFHIDYSVDHKA